MLHVLPDRRFLHIVAGSIIDVLLYTLVLEGQSLRWRHNERDGVSNRRRIDCLLNRLFRRRSKKTSKLCVTGLCEGNSPVTGEFPAQRARNVDFFLFNDVIGFTRLLKLEIFWKLFRCQECIKSLVFRLPSTINHSLILTHWTRVTHICVSKLGIIGTNNGLSPVRCQAIIWTNADLLSIGPLGRNFSDIYIRLPQFSFSKLHLKMSSAKRRLFCLGVNALKPFCIILLQFNWRSGTHIFQPWDFNRDKTMATRQTVGQTIETPVSRDAIALLDVTVMPKSKQLNHNELLHIPRQP